MQARANEAIDSNMGDESAEIFDDLYLGLRAGGALRKQIFESKNGPAVLDAIEAFFASRHETSVEDFIEDSETTLEALGAGCD